MKEQKTFSSPWLLAQEAAALQLTPRQDPASPLFTRPLQKNRTNAMCLRTHRQSKINYKEPTQLCRLTSPKTCRQQAGDLAELMLQFMSQGWQA